MNIFKLKNNIIKFITCLVVWLCAPLKWFNTYVFKVLAFIVSTDKEDYDKQIEKIKKDDHIMMFLHMLFIIAEVLLIIVIVGEKL